MFSRSHKHEHNFHDNAALHDQTPEVQSILAGLPSDAAAIGQLLVHGIHEDGKRAAIAKLPLNNPTSKWFMAKGVKHYWGSMLHPPLSYRGDTFQYRSADGADNNILHPQLGKAGLPYAKSVPGKSGIHGARPDPGDLFDLLLARKDDKDSESGMSSMLLYHATIIIHDIFRTNADDKNISDTSSYLDLSPLYGVDKASQDTVREGRLGLLKPDTFAETRLLNQPPGVCIYLIMYNRFHNYVAQQLLEINENGKFSLQFPEGSKEWNAKSEEDKKAMKAKQDEDLFQTARLITCGMYINISIHDYLRVLMGFHTKDTAWTLDPRIEIPGTDDKTGIQRGIGNQVSVEFNLLYRFHGPISQRDRKWSEMLFKQGLRRALYAQHLNEGKKGDLSEQEVHDTREWIETQLDEWVSTGDIPVPFFKNIIDAGNRKGKSKEDKEKDLEQGKSRKWFPVGLELIHKVAKDGKPVLDMNGDLINDYKFKRDPETGKFDDAQLVAEMAKVIEDPICQFGAQNVPKIFKAIEILGILQARKWEVATLNEFREFFGLERHKHFEDINEDTGITDALRDLYEDPDMVELYPGLMCEGKGRCLDPGTTGPNHSSTALWAGVFCDAVTLVRSDRFYTLDWNVGSLTSWGMREVTSDPNINKGSVFHRLFQRAFPGYLKYNSIHLWQPFYTPARNLKLAHEQGYLPSLEISDLDLDKKLKFELDVKNRDEFMKRKDYTQLTRNVRQKIAVEEPVPEAARPRPAIAVSNYDVIRNVILGSRKIEFQNPGVIDSYVLANETLGSMLKGTSESFSKATAVLQDLVKPETQEMFMTYFTGMSHEITQREQRSLQKLEPTVKYFQMERRKLEKLNLADDILNKERTELDRIEKQLKFRALIANEKNASVKKGLEKQLSETGKQISDKDLAKIGQIYQLDVVKDFAIPVITRFVADFLGFWDFIKTPKHKGRQYDENQIYQHIHNCQDYLSYDPDETLAWKRREAFKKSIVFLKEKTEHGVYQTEEWPFGLFSRNNKTKGDKDYVVALRDFGVKTSRALRKVNLNNEEVAAVMLVVALDVAHKSVMNFTEVLSYFIDHPHVGKPKVADPKKPWVKMPDAEDDGPSLSNWVQPWIKVQNLAYSGKPDDDEELKRYVLEAQRIFVDKRYEPKETHYQADLPLVRVFNSESTFEFFLSNKPQKGEQPTKLRKGDKVLLQLKQAQNNEKVFPQADTFSTDKNKRKLKDYLIYGQDGNTDERFGAKQLTLVALTGMIKFIAKQKDLRVAHDKLGRLKRAKTPYGVESYMTIPWDQLVSFPTTWNLRFNGTGRGVYDGPDNADQGHGINQVYQKPCDIPSGGSYNSGSTDKTSTLTAPGAPLANGAVAESFANGAPKW